MERGELYRVEKPTARDPKSFRIFVIVSRQKFIETRYLSVICAPVYTNSSGLPTEVEIGTDEELKHNSAIRCDELLSLPKYKLTNFIGSLPQQKIKELNEALKHALGLENE